MEIINSLIRFSLKNRLTIFLGALLLIVGGIVSWQRMDIDVFPDLTAPTVVVMTDTHGMAAEEVERLVTFPIETAVNGATNVRRVRSASMYGFSFVWAEFNWGTDVYRARQIVSEKMVALAGTLPNGITPVLAPQSSIMGEILLIGMQVRLHFPEIADRLTPVIAAIEEEKNCLLLFKCDIHSRLLSSWSGIKGRCGLGGLVLPSSRNFSRTDLRSAASAASRAALAGFGVPAGGSSGRLLMMPSNWLSFCSTISSMARMVVLVAAASVTKRSGCRIISTRSDMAGSSKTTPFSQASHSCQPAMVMVWPPSPKKRRWSSVLSMVSSV